MKNMIFKTETIKYRPMKKITLVLAFIGMIGLTSCVREETVVQDTYDQDTISEVFELRNVNFSYDSGEGNYFIYKNLNPVIYDSDVLLIYRLTGTINSNTPIWQLIPRTLYLPQGELDYDFDFSRQDFKIYAGGTYDLSLTPNYIYNQTFRIVIIPGYFSDKNAQQIDFNDYNAVVKAYKIDESKVKKIKM